MVIPVILVIKVSLVILVMLVIRVIQYRILAPTAVKGCMQVLVYNIDSDSVNIIIYFCCLTSHSTT